MELTTGVGDLLELKNLQILETEILPKYLKKRRWFASKDQEIRKIRLLHAGLAKANEGDILFAEIEVELTNKIECYQLPLAIDFTDYHSSSLVHHLKLADVTIAGQSGVLTDAFSLDVLPITLVKAMTDEGLITVIGTNIKCLSSASFSATLPMAPIYIRRLSAEQSNSSLVIDDRIIIKLIRSVMHGINPEVEMIRYLTEHQYAHTPALLGEVRYSSSNGTEYSMYVIQKFLDNQGDAWAYTLEVLQSEPEKYHSYKDFAAALGVRLAELHEVLSRPTSEEAFIPRIANEHDATDWELKVTQQVRAAFAVLDNTPNFVDVIERDKTIILALREHIFSKIAELSCSLIGSLMTRIHGDFHLGQVLVSKGDAYIIDFEGEPSKPLDVRRAKSLPMRDVAGLLRSLQYASGINGFSNAHFVKEMSNIYLRSYRSTLDRVIQPQLANTDSQEKLLNLCLLEKCAYEICYESANRPEWLAIPLRGFLEIVTRILGVTDMIDA